MNASVPLPATETSIPTSELLDAFRRVYADVERRVQHALANSMGDPVVFQRLNDDVEQYRLLVEQVSSLDRNPARNPA